jgi:hypothetical protein
VNGRHFVSETCEDRAYACCDLNPDPESLDDPSTSPLPAGADWYDWHVEQYRAHIGACLGCGRLEPMGVHYPDCSLLEEGDPLMPRGLSAEKERAVDEARLAVYEHCSCAMWERHDTGERIFSGRHGDECELPDLAAASLPANAGVGLAPS